MTEEADILEAYVRLTVAEDLKPWPGGYPDDLDLAILDAVFSIQARYGRVDADTGKATGVAGVVKRWREQRGDRRLPELASIPSAELREITNGWTVNVGQKHRALKSDVVRDVASRFIDKGIVTAEDFRAHEELAGKVYRSVPGCGWVTWRYLRMLAGRQDIKPDTWVMRFVQDVLPAGLSADQTAGLLYEVAERLQVEPVVLDHSIWCYRRGFKKSQVPEAAAQVLRG